jgi:hypothetical protein
METRPSDRSVAPTSDAEQLVDVPTAATLAWVFTSGRTFEPTTGGKLPDGKLCGSGNALLDDPP